MHPLTRQIPLEPAQSALLFIDVQNFAIHRNSSEFAHLNEQEFTAQYGWFFEQFYTNTLANMHRTSRVSPCGRGGHVHDHREPDAGRA